MRFVIGVVLALSVGIGAYLGSAQAAGSATARARTVKLRYGDVAVVGQVQCRAWTDSRSHLGANLSRDREAYMECSKGPWNRAALSVTVGPVVNPVAVNVSNRVGKASCYWWEGPSGKAHPIFSAYLRCQKGPHSVSSVEVKVLPSGIAVFKKGKMAYRTGWNG